MGSDEYETRARLSSGCPAASYALGHDHAYIQQYIRRGTPEWLAERDRELLCRLYDLDPARLRPPAKQAPAHREYQPRIDPQSLDHIARDPGTAELLRGWMRIKSDEDRAVALSVIAAFAAKETDSVIAETHDLGTGFVCK